MSCPRCGAETRSDQKFCSDCGLLLSRSCPNCGAAYDGTPRFCAECGTPLPGPAGETSSATPRPSSTAPAAGEASAERRHVSVLFADLVGFTQLSEQHDAEEVRDLLSNYFETCRQVIERYGGAVEKFIGDAVMAVWGAPVAREDDSERAVRAALELVDRTAALRIGSAPLTLRAGVLSGEAAVTPGRVGEGMVAGDLVNTASRLQSVAPAGTVLVGDETFRATGAAIAYEPAGEHLLKGKSSPVPAWRALRVVAQRGGRGRSEALEPPFVGREDELRLLKDQLVAAGRDQRLRLVSILGQAGLGKSRLAWELLKYVDGVTEVIYWHEGRSPSYGEGVTFWALGEMVRRRCGISEAEDAESTREKLRTTLADFVPDESERRRLEPALGALLGIEDVPDWDAREQLFSAWRTFFERISERGTTVLVFEDLQWADGGLLDFIEHLVEWARSRPILLVTLARPEILDRRPGWGVSQRAFIALHLEPIPDKQMEALLQGLVPGMPERALRRIVERAAGVPLYAVEMIRSLVDSGHLVRSGEAYELVREPSELEVPATLHALIASRLDSLDAGDRALLQDAAVLGLVFSLPALAALTGRETGEIEERLKDLARKELVALETDPQSPERGQYRFVQGLIREVAYGTLGKRDRRRRHLAAARYFETLGDDELVGVLASHYVDAYEAAPETEEASAIAAQARVALRAAHDRAARLHSDEQALAYAERALSVTFDENEQAAVHVEAARSASKLDRFETVEAHLRPAIDWYSASGDEIKLAEAKWLLALDMNVSSRVDQALDLLPETIASLPPVPEAEPIAVRLYSELARSHLFRGESVEALDAISKAVDMAERLRLTGLLPELLNTKSWALMRVGHVREGASLLWGVLRLLQAEPDLNLPAITRAHLNLSSYVAYDQPRLGLSLASDGLDIARRYGMVRATGWLLGNATESAMLVGDLGTATRLLNEVSAESGYRANLWARGLRARMAAMLGDSESSDRNLEEMKEMLSSSTSSQDVIAYTDSAGWAAFWLGRLDDARRLAYDPTEFSAFDGGLGTVLAAHCDTLLGDRRRLAEDLTFLEQAALNGAWADRWWRTAQAAALALDGETDEARQAYRKLVVEWREADLPLDLVLVLFERSRLLGEQDDEAATGRAEADEIVAQLGAEGLIDRIEAGVSPPPAPAAPADRRQRTAAVSG